MAQKAHRTYIPQKHMEYVMVHMAHKAHRTRKAHMAQKGHSTPPKLFLIIGGEVGLF